MSTSNLKPKGLSWFYHRLQNNFSYTKTSSMTNWEKNLNVSYASSEWNKAIQPTYKHSHCTNHLELAFKLVHRSHLIPCWRDCGSKGTLFHVMWECKSVRSFWNSIFNLLAKLTRNFLPPNPTLALLNLGIDKIPMQHRCVITHILIAAHLTITSNWRTDKAPNLIDVINRVKSQHLY